MKINEILVESQQLDEGPLGSAAGAVARGAGKVIGGVAKGVGALAGIPGGVAKAFKKGKQASTDFIGGDKKAADADSGEEPAAQQSQPAAQAAAPSGQAAAQPQQSGGFVQGFKQGMGIGGKQAPAATTTSQVNKQGPSGTAPAKVSGAAQQQALAKTAQAAGGDSTKAAQTLYATVKSQVNQLDKKGKQRILQLLQKSLQQTPAAAPAAAPATGPGSKTAGTTAAGQPKVEPDLNAPVEQPATAAGKKKPAPRKKAAPSQAEIDADREAKMGPTSDSVIRKGNMVAEGFTLFKR